jgi:hypothetical protein
MAELWRLIHCSNVVYHYGYNPISIVEMDSLTLVNMFFVRKTQDLHLKSILQETLTFMDIYDIEIVT